MSNMIKRISGALFTASLISWGVMIYNHFDIEKINPVIVIFAVIGIAVAVAIESIINLNN